MAKDDDIKIGIDATPAESGEKRVVAALGRIKKSASDLGRTASKDITKITTALNKIKSSTITLRLNTGDGMARLNKFGAALAKINARTDVKINIQAALGQIQRLQNALDRATARLTRTELKIRFDSQSVQAQIQRLGQLILSLERVRPRITMDTSNVDNQIMQIANKIARLSRVQFTPGMTVGAGTASTLRALANFKGFDPAAITSVRAMSQAINSLRIGPNVANGFRQFALAAAMMTRLNNSMQQTASRARNVSSSFMRLHSDSLTLSGGILRTSAAMQNLVAIMGLGSIANTISVYQKTMAGLTAVTGSTENAAAEFQWASDTADKFSVSLGSIAPNYMQLVAAGNAAGISMDKIHDIFDGVTQASRVFGLSVEDTEGVYRALTQIIAKGSLQMEELRGQLGDRLPVAVNAFAKGLGVTTRELFKMTQMQEVTGETLERGLVGFGNTLRDMTKGGLADTLNSIPAAIGRLQTAFLKFSIFLNEAGLGQAITNILDALTALLTVKTENNGLTTFGRVVGFLAKAFEELTNHMGLLATLMLGVFATGMIRMVASMVAAQRAAAATGGAMSGLIGALGKFNLVMIGITAAVTIFDALTRQTSEAEKAQEALIEAQKSGSSVTLSVANGIDSLRNSYSQLTAEQKKAERTSLLKAISDGEVAIAQIDKSLRERRSMWSEDIFDKAGVDTDKLPIYKGGIDGITQKLVEMRDKAGDSYLALKSMNEELSGMTLPENAQNLADFFGTSLNEKTIGGFRAITQAFLDQSVIMQTAIEDTARYKFQLAVVNNTLDQLDPTTRAVAEAMGWYSKVLEDVAQAQNEVVSDADRFNRWADSLDIAMNQVANKAQIVAATLRGIRYEQALIKNSELLESTTATAKTTVSGAFGKEFADSGLGRFAANVIGVGQAAYTTAQIEAARERFETSKDGAEDYLRDLGKPKKGGGMGKDDFNDIVNYTKESTKLTLEYERAQQKLNEAAAKYPDMIAKAGGMESLRAQMAAKYHRELQVALEAERTTEWDDKYLTVDKKLQDILNGARELTPIEEATNQLYEQRRQIFILLGDSDKARAATAEMELRTAEKTNRAMRERGGGMRDKYLGTNYQGVMDVEADIRELNRDQNAIGGQMMNGNFSNFAQYQQNANTLIQMNQQLKIAQLESTKLGQAFSASADAIGSALTDLVMNGKMDVRQLITTILNEFFKLLVIEPLMRQLKSAMGDWLGGSGGSGGFSIWSILGIGHTGGMVGSLQPAARKFHTGGIVPRGGVSTSGMRSWETMANVPKGSEILKEYDRRHSKNMMPVMLKAGEEVVPPWDSRNFTSKYHTGGMAGSADPAEMAAAMRDGDYRNNANDNRVGGGSVTIQNNNKFVFQGVAPRSDTADASKFAEKVAANIAEETSKSSRISAVKTRVNTRDMKMI